MNVSLQDNNLQASTFYSLNNSKILGISTKIDKEAVTATGRLDISTVTKNHPDDLSNDIHTTYIHPSSVTIDGATPYIVSSVTIEEPAIIKQSGATVNKAMTFYIKSAPTEGTENYGMYVDAASNKINGNLDVKTLSIDGELFDANLQSLANLSAVTASSADINILENTTVTATEFNYLNGVTASIQTQLSERLTQAEADNIIILNKLVQLVVLQLEQVLVT